MFRLHENFHGRCRHCGRTLTGGSLWGKTRPTVCFACLTGQRGGVKGFRKPGVPGGKKKQ